MGYKTHSEEAIEKATGKSWKEWLEYFSSINAQDLKHGEIVVQTAKDHTVDGWWIQALVVKYEQHIGRRKPGQGSDGKYSVSVSKTVPGTMDEVFDKWVAANLQEINGQRIIGEPRISKTEKWRYWRAELEGGIKLIASVQSKTPEKSIITLTSESFSSQDLIEEWRSVLKEQLS